MASSRRVAVVTGGNSGIGHQVVKNLCQQFDGDVILAAYKKEWAEESAKELKEKENFDVTPFHVDIRSKEHVEKLKEFLLENYGGLDILVNNAGTSLRVEIFRERGMVDKLTQGEIDMPLTEIADTVIGTNWKGTLLMSQTLTPILRPGARVVSLASRGARFAIRNCSEEKKKILLTQYKTVEEVQKVLDTYYEDIKQADFKAKGWSDNFAYPLSKWAIIQYTNIMQNALPQDKDILVNVCCPGLVATPMNNFSAGVHVTVGADSPTYLALLAPGTVSPRGDFVGERKVISLSDDGERQKEQLKKIMAGMTSDLCDDMAKTAIGK